DRCRGGLSALWQSAGCRHRWWCVFARRDYGDRPDRHTARSAQARAGRPCGRGTGLTGPPMSDLIQTITVYALPVLFGITLHEAAHGYVARMFGDPTAWQEGRITLNPIRHIDPVGTIVVPLVLLFSTKL